MVTDNKIFPPIPESDLQSFKPQTPNPGPIRVSTAELPNDDGALFDAAFGSLQQSQPQQNPDDDLFNAAMTNLPAVEPSKGLVDNAVDWASEKAGRAGTALGSVPFAMGQGAWGALETVARAGQEYVEKPFNQAMHSIGVPETANADLFSAIGDTAQRAAEVNRQTSDYAMSKAQKDAGFIERNVYNAIQSVGFNIPGMAASVITGNPAPALISIGIMSGGRSGSDALKEGASPGRALLHSFTVGSVEAGTEAAPFLWFMKDLKAGSGLMKTMLHQAISETPSEMAATALQNFSEWVNLHPEKNFEDYLKTTLADEADTVATTLFAVGMQTGILHTGNRLMGGGKQGEEQTPSPPTKDDLAAKLSGEKPAPPPPPAGAAPQGDIAPGDRIEHMSESTGEIVSGTVQGVRNAPDGRVVQVMQDDGTLATVFEGDGQITTTQRAERDGTFIGDVPGPTRDDLQSVLSGEKRSLTEDQEERSAIMEFDGGMTREQAEKAVTSEPFGPKEMQGPRTFKQMLPELSDQQLMDAYSGKNARNSRLAGEELDRRYPERSMTEEIDVEQAAAQVDTAPTEAQKKAGNYKKGLVSIQGLPITIENPKGSVRSGVDSDGETWNVTMPSHYGYIKRTTGADGDHVDVYIGPNPQAQEVYVIDQIDPDTKKFDEHKSFVGFDRIQDAVDAYNGAFNDGRAEQRIGGMTIMTVPEFKEWVRSPETKKPLNYAEPEENNITFEPPQIPENKPSEPAEQEAPQSVEEQATQEAEPPPPQETETQTVPALQGPRQGEVGMKLSTGETVLTTTGRETTPFPRFTTKSGKTTAKHIRAVDMWLIENALAEARARGDNFNARQFEDETKTKGEIPQASKNHAESYLFDPEFVTGPTESLLKDFTPSNNEGDTEQSKPGQEPADTTKPQETAPAEDVSDTNVAETEQADQETKKPTGRFHGTSSKIKSVDEYTYNEMNIYGQGLYTTDDFDIAQKYTKKGKGSEPTVYRVKPKGDLKIFDLEQPLSSNPEALQKINDAAEYDNNLAMAVEAAQEYDNPLFRHIYDELRDTPDTSADVIQESMDTLQYVLEKMGYAGVSHIGGRLTGGQKHNVIIYFNPRRDLELTEYRKGDNAEEAPQEGQPAAEQEAPQPETTTDKPDGQGQNPDLSGLSGRGKRLEDVGERMEGKRAFRENMKDKTVSEQAKQIIASTKPKEVFKFDKRDGQTEGVARFAQELQRDLHDFSSYLKDKRILRKKSGRRDKTPGWEEQVKLFFSDAAETDGVDIGWKHYSPDMVRAYRADIIKSAEDYIEFGQQLNDMFAAAEDINRFKTLLKAALQNSDFSLAFGNFGKGYSLSYDIFSESKWSKYGRITDDTEVKQTKRATPMTRPKLEKIEREGLKDYRGGRDVTPDDFRQKFGFRGVEFGEWVNAAEGQAHLNHAYDALLDLAERLNIKPSHISLGGKLGFAFGSRGSGEHAAHYERETKVINLTKTKGDGSVAHEWGHALDFALRDSADGKRIMDMMYNSLSHKMLPLESLEDKIRDFLAGRMWYEGIKKGGPIANARKHLEFTKRSPLYYMATKTDFQDEGNALGKDYWGSGVELFARSWESFIFDTLDGRSPYLVSDWVGDGVVTKEAGYRGRPYPTGDERSNFRDTFEELLKLIEFSDDGVKVREGAKLPLDRQIEELNTEANRLMDALPDLMKEIEDAGVQRNKVQAGVSDGDGAAGAQDVPGHDTGADSENAFETNVGAGQGGAQRTGGETGAGTRDEQGGSRSGGDRDRVQPDDTVLSPDKDAPPSFEAKGSNHVIVVGALDEKRGEKTKAKDNIEIIKKVKVIEQDNRAATPEERELLAKYTGWGSIDKVFPRPDGSIADGWKTLHDDLKAVLTEEEWKAAEKTIPFAHYTSEIVVRQMWKAMERFGLKQGTIFEPGMGIGNFPGMMPESLRQTIKYSGIEYDAMSSRVARILYPESSVRHADYIEARYGDDTFAAAIGNPPFAEKGQIGHGDKKYNGLSLHNFFFAKTIDKVALGGVIAFVTSRYSMDTIDADARKRFSEQVDLIGAIRLPNTAFKTNAHTEVVTDIIFLRKRLPGEESNGVKWLESKPLALTDKNGKAQHINEYFHDNPEMILGNLSMTGTMYGSGQLTVEPAQNADLQRQIEEAIDRLPEKIVGEIKTKAAMEEDFNPQETKEGSYYLMGDTLMQVVDGVGQQVPLRGKGAGGITKKQHDQIRMLVPMRDSLRRVMDAMIARDDATMREAQKELSDYHAKFVKKYGPVAKTQTITRPATPGDIEKARQAQRLDYEDSGNEFDEGDIDLTHLLDAENPETGKKYTLAQIGSIRKKMREEMEAEGRTVDEGSFDPDLVEDRVKVVYENLDAMKADPEYYNLLILENYDEETGKATKTDVFSKNIVAEVKKPTIETAVDALNYSMALRNRIDIDLMAQELGRNADSIINELIELDLIYKLPSIEDFGHVYVGAEDYLSGNVKDKLAYAKKLAQGDNDYARNVTALEAVQPEDVPPSRINTQLGSPYFDEQTVKDFMRDALNISVGVRYNGTLNKWEVNAHDRYQAENTSQYGTGKRPATSLMESLLMRKTITVTTTDQDGKNVVLVDETQKARDKAKILQEKFDDWIWKGNHGERIHRKFNDEYNNIVPRRFNGDHIQIAISPSIFPKGLRKHQKNVIWRVLQSGNTYFAHAVGAGKSAEIAGTAMEMRRLGIWKKPCVVVPNHMLAQFAAEFRMMFPQAKLLVADEEQFHKDRRQRFVANAAKGDWDSIIVTYSAYERLPVSGSFEASMIEREIERFREALRDEGGEKSKSMTAKRLQKKIAKMESQMKALRRNDKDQSFTFEETGIDAVLVDEAHNFRKLSFPTNQGNVRGIDPAGSKRAWDMYIKTRYLDTVSPGRNLVMASGTPLTNTLAEIFTMQRFMNERGLIERGLDNFDRWSASFAKKHTSLELQPNGAFKSVERLSQFANLDVLSPMTREFMDVVTSEELGNLVDRPTVKTGRPINVVVDPTREMLAFRNFLDARMKEIENSRKRNQKGQDNILSIILEGRMAAIDMRLIDPTLPEQDSKLNKMIDNVFDIWKRASDDTFKVMHGAQENAKNKGGVQLIFSDLGVTPKSRDGKTFSAYEHIRRKLIRMGVPSSQIAIANEYTTTEQKARLQAHVRNGDIRVLIGSTEKMGTGWNVQNRLKALHHLDSKYNPADMEQREGRILRQGNQYKEIEIYTYSTEQSYDTTMWGMLERKAKAIGDFMKGDLDVSEMEDISEVDNYAIAKATTSGDARILRQYELKKKVEDLWRKAKNFKDDQIQIKSKISRAKNDISWNTDYISDITDAESKIKPLKEGQFLMVVNGKPFSERAEAGGAIEAAVNAVVDTGRFDGDSRGVKIGEYQGFDIRTYISSTLKGGWNGEIFIDHPAFTSGESVVNFGSEKSLSGSGTITRLSNRMGNLSKAKENAHEIIERSKREIKVFESQIADKFPQEKEYESSQEELNDIEKDLAANAPVEVVYDNYPVEYWAGNKAAMKGDTRFMIVGDDEFSFRYSEDATPKDRRRIIRDVSERAKKLGFNPEKLKIKIAEELTDQNGNKVAGVYHKGVIYLAMSDDAASVLDHEAIHALYAAGAFNERDWQTLRNRAKQWRVKYDIDSRYAGQNLTEAQLDEEAIAEAFRDFALSGPEKGLVGRIYHRTMRFIEAIREVLKGKKWNFKTAEDIFRSVDRGEAGPRMQEVKTNPEFDYKGDRIVYALSRQKNKALKEADAFLNSVSGMDTNLRPSLGKVSAYILHPSQISALHKAFTPVYQTALNMFKRRDLVVHELSNHISLYNKINRQSKKKIDAVLEIGRLKKENFKPDENGKIVVKNDDIETAKHSKPGDTITLTDAEVQAYLGVRSGMNRALDIYIETILEEYGYAERGIKNRQDLEKAYAKEKDEKELERMEEVIKILSDIEAAKRSGYIPLKRWGEIGITVRMKAEEGKRGDLVYFQRVELPKVGKNKVIGKNKVVREAVAALKEKYPDAEFDIQTFQVKSYEDIRGQLNLNELDLLAASSDMSEEDYRILRKMLQEEQQRRGFRAHFFKANDVPGYSDDFERAINDYVVSIAGHLARRTFASEFTKSLGAIAEGGQKDLYDYAKAYVSYINDPQEEFASLRQMGFMWYLAGNLASGLTNATQPIMVTAPWFKGMFSHAEIAKEMGAAYKDGMAMFDPVNAGTDMFNFDKAPEDVRAALQEAVAEGDFIPLYTHEAMGIARTGKAHLRGLDRVKREMQDYLSLTFSTPERLNRIVTYIAAYRFAIQPKNRQKILDFIGNDENGKYEVSGKSGESFAMGFADYAVVSTQFRMGKANRPTLARGAGTLAFQFMSFSMQAFELMYRLSEAHGGKKGQALGIMLLTVIAMSGLRGFPFADDLKDLIEQMWKMVKRTDLDIDTEMRVALTKAVGPQMADALLRGLPAALLNVDMSGRLGYGNALPDTESDLLGIWYDMLVVKPEQSMAYLAKGDVGMALSNVSPAVLKNMIQAYLWTKEGVRSSTTGDKIIAPEDLTKADIYLKAMGFTSGEVSAERERLYSVSRADRAANDLRADYYDRLAKAIVMRNKMHDTDRAASDGYEAQRQAIMDEIHAYNETVPVYRQVIIQQSSLKQAVGKEIMGAKSRKQRKQARSRADEINAAYGR